MRLRNAALGLLLALAMGTSAQAGPLAQNVLRNLGWWYGPGYAAFNTCPGYPQRCWAYMPTTFPAPVPWGVAMPQRGACQNCGPGGYGYSYGAPEIFHYPTTPYNAGPAGGVEVIEQPMPEGAVGPPVPQSAGPAPAPETP